MRTFTKFSKKQKPIMEYFEKQSKFKSLSVCVSCYCVVNKVPFSKNRIKEYQSQTTKRLQHSMLIMPSID